MRSIEADVLRRAASAASEWAAIAATSATQSKTRTTSDRARVCIAGQAAGRTGWRDLFRHLLHRQEGRDARLGRDQDHPRTPIPTCAQRLIREQDRVWALVERRRTIEARDRSVALFTIAHAVIERYRAEKNRRGLLDYDDLIDKTLDLLERRGGRLGALQARPRHPSRADRRGAGHQPEAVGHHQALVGEFFAGAGARDRPRTIFAVGDEKQSIFSFQGAVPQRVRGNAPAFRDARTATRSMTFASSPFKHSFRSGAQRAGGGRRGVQAAAGPRGLTADPVRSRARGGAAARRPACRDLGAGEAGREARPIEGWDAPLDARLGDQPHGPAGARRSPRVKLDRRGDAVTTTRPRLRPGDVLDPGAPARRAVRGDHPRAEERRHPGRGRRPADADRAYRGHGPDGARRCAAAAGGRSRARHRAQEPAVRPRRRRAVRARLEPARHAARGAARTAAGRRSARLDAHGRRRARRQTPFTFYARLLGAGGGRQKFSRGSATKPPTRSTSSSISRSTTSAARRRRCKASWRGCAPRSRGEARHGHGARRGAGDDRARREGPGSADRHPGRHHDAGRRAAIRRGCCRCRRATRPGRRCVVWADAKSGHRADGGGAR